MKTLANYIIHETPWLKLNETHYLNKNGTKCHWTWVERIKTTQTVNIIASVENNKEQKLVVIKEWRHPISDYEWSMPAGLLDPGENPAKAAKRELKEETGLDIIDIRNITPFIYNTAGLTNESTCIVYCTAKGEITKENQEGTEDIETYLIGRKEMCKLLCNPNVKFGAKAYLIFNRFVQEEVLF